jgi:hypothetical protein
MLLVADENVADEVNGGGKDAHLFSDRPKSLMT